MPQIKIKNINCFSSEEENYPASNLLKDKKKWKGQIGAKTSSVTFELAHPTTITAIDIGNEHSCFIEVLVGRRGCSDGEFKEILLTSSFMTPTESRNSDNPNRVRCFSQNSLVESVSSQKWDLVKVICSQPFNSRVSYGIAFVKIYGDEGERSEPPAALNSSSTKKELFRLREDSPDTETESLFSKWKQNSSKHNETDSVRPASSVAAAIRDAVSTPTRDKSPVQSFTSQKSKTSLVKGDNEKKPRDRNRANDLLYDDEDENKADKKLEDFIKRDQEKADKEKESKAKPLVDQTINSAQKKAPQSIKISKKFTDPNGEEAKLLVDKTINSAKKKVQPVEVAKQSTESNGEEGPSMSRVEGRVKPAKKAKLYKPFMKLLSGVVLTISGIQNPDRSDLRTKAIAMGAKYKPDWDDSCTHLICAFRNTPKFNQVQGKGKIVRKDWVLQCYSNRKRIPWRRYALDRADGDKSESEDEFWDENGKDEDSILEEYKEGQREEEAIVLDEDSEDTEDEIRKVQNIGQPAQKSVYDMSTDDEGEDMKSQSTNFFSDKKFFLDNDIGAVKAIKLNSIITKYKGEVVEDKTGSDYWIKTGLSVGKETINSACKTVKPLWVEECAETDSLLPIKRYLL